MNNAADIEQKAAEWLVRRDGDAWSDKDQAAFDAWIAEATSHRIAVIRLETVWRKAGRLRASVPRGEQAAPPPDPAIDVTADRDVAPRRRWLWPAAIAASLALVSVPVYRNLQAPDSYSTGVGGFQRLPLADGSHVDLNTNSRLAVAFSAAERQLDLERGEAFFKVAKNPQRPFIVQAGAYRITAVGTAFAVRRNGNGVDVVVTEGRVRIDPPPVNGGAGRPIYASAGQVATAVGAAPVVRPLGGTAIDTALSWRDGLLIFEDRPLGEVTAEFNRYNRVQLVVDPSATDVVIDGSFRATNLQGFLRLLDQGFHVESVRDGSNVLVLKKTDRVIPHTG